MAPSVAHLHSLLVRNAKILKAAWKQTSRIIENHLPSSTRPAQAEVQTLLARNAPRQPLHPLAALRQSKGRWYTTHSAINAAVRRFTATANASAKHNRASFPKSRIGTIVQSSTGRAPFATTLRPNLTGGTLGRTAGGYGFGGSARYFSHTPAAPAQVINNVSQAVRAFILSGKRAQFDGVDSRTGEKRFRLVSPLQQNVGRKMKNLPKATPGSYIDFAINPTITALAPMSSVAGYTSMQCQETINTEGLLDILAVDFSRSLKQLSAVLGDIKKLSALGDLPISYRVTSLRVHFPGCDAETVARLCEDFGVSRGVVVQDKDFDAFTGTEIALLFPFAPSESSSQCSFLDKPIEQRIIEQEPVQWQTMLSPEVHTETEYSTQSDVGLEFEEIEENAWISSPSGYASVHSSDISESDSFDKFAPMEYQGFEGIYRFMEECGPSPSRR